MAQGPEPPTRQFDVSESGMIYGKTPLTWLNEVWQKCRAPNKTALFPQCQHVAGPPNSPIFECIFDVTLDARIRVTARGSNKNEAKHRAAVAFLTELGMRNVDFLNLMKPEDRARYLPDVSAEVNPEVAEEENSNKEEKRDQSEMHFGLDIDGDKEACRQVKSKEVDPHDNVGVGSNDDKEPLDKKAKSAESDHVPEAPSVDKTKKSCCCSNCSCKINVTIPMSQFADQSNTGVMELEIVKPGNEKGAGTSASCKALIRKADNNEQQEQTDAALVGAWGGEPIQVEPHINMNENHNPAAPSGHQIFSRETIHPGFEQCAAMNYIQAVADFCEKYGLSAPVYEKLSQTGASHRPVFRMIVTIPKSANEDEHSITCEDQSSLKVVKKMCAFQLYKSLLKLEADIAQRLQDQTKPKLDREQEELIKQICSTYLKSQAKPTREFNSGFGEVFENNFTISEKNFRETFVGPWVSALRARIDHIREEDPLDLLVELENEFKSCCQILIRDPFSKGLLGYKAFGFFPAAVMMIWYGEAKSFFALEKTPENAILEAAYKLLEHIARLEF